MLTPVRRWPFASRRTLDEDTQHGDHRQSAVLNLLNLQDFQILRGGRDVVKVQRSPRLIGSNLAKSLPVKEPLNGTNPDGAEAGSDRTFPRRPSRQSTERRRYPTTIRPGRICQWNLPKTPYGFSPVAAGDVEEALPE